MLKYLLDKEQRIEPGLVRLHAAAVHLERLAFQASSTATDEPQYALHLLLSRSRTAGCTSPVSRSCDSHWPTAAGVPLRDEPGESLYPGPSLPLLLRAEQLLPPNLLEDMCFRNVEWELGLRGAHPSHPGRPKPQPPMAPSTSSRPSLSASSCGCSGRLPTISLAKLEAVLAIKPAPRARGR